MALIEVQNLKKYFPVKQGPIDVLLRKPRKFVKAVDGVNFQIDEGKSLGLVGESGSGKTTTGRVILRLEEPTDGKIIFDGRDITKLSKEEMRKLRKEMQIIFQDPMASLNPYMRVGKAIEHALEIHGIGDRSSRKEMVLEMLRRVNLEPAKDIYRRYPRELSGGQRQRVVIARALILKPRLVVADEAVAMLDVSVRSQLLRLLQELRKEFNLTMLFITHDLATTKYVCDEIAVMYLGKIVEIGDFEDIYLNPKHPYTQALISAVPEPSLKKKKKFIPEGETPNPIDVPSGCRFHPRCPYRMDICMKEEPQLKAVEENHKVACHLYN
ncbi:MULTISPECIES: ABC transporter ATP-binding protein [unclassified Thermotoga]|uniref:ABC transporter ATP-binding protein n=1 Tax=unclassified Thermotoga TaxID=2631113 RepID=UPI000280E96E|nr:MULTISPECIES: ABC transporter ATP-binding protein [unclassified Thermotoga]AIY87174.1 peptide ABC transporter ATP-binding protein [Thermotoga sp. 2812B]EJX25261.1 peptide ABC transporter ATP-binding protein [Thermotoga sp. EMP]